MDKVSVALASGNSIEKPLVSAFKGNLGSYVVLDNEQNGTMGLPIILVSKYNNNRLEKIIDQTEWGMVKEYLRNIIAGNQMNYIKVPTSFTADDNFFSQLTLPVVSFESLKANYKPAEESSVAGDMGPVIVTPNPQVEVPIPEVPHVEAPVNNVEVNPVPSVMPTVEPAPQVVSPMSEVSPVNNIEPNPVPNVMPVVEPVAPVPDSVSVEPTVTPVVPNEPVSSVVQPTMPVEPAPMVEPIPPVVEETPIDFTEEKEAFMKTCENIFDALVAKINK